MSGVKLNKYEEFSPTCSWPMLGYLNSHPLKIMDRGTAIHNFKWVKILKKIT